MDVPSEVVGLLGEKMKSNLYWIIAICVLWMISLYGENIFIHAYYRGLTLTSEIRAKLSKDEIAEIEKRTEDRFRNTYISYMAPLSIATFAAYGLYCVRNSNKIKTEPNK